MKKIYINPGHSNRDPGAIGYETERQLNVKVSAYQAAYLQENYLCEIRVGSGDDLMALCQEANDWGADLFVSNHNNSGMGDGYENYVYGQNRVELGKIFARYVAEAGQNLRSSSVAPGVKLQPGYIVLKYTHMPAILNEGAFVDNQQDIADWNEDHELQALGIAYAKAAAEFLNLEKKAQPVYFVHYSTRLGPFQDQKTAETIAAALQAAGYEGEVTQ